MRIVNPITIRPNELKSGDVMMVTVVCYIERWDDQILAKIYKAPYPNTSHNAIPQGPKIAEVVSEDSDGYDLMRLLFPVVMYEMDNLKQK